MCQDRFINQFHLKACFFVLARGIYRFISGFFLHQFTVIFWVIMCDIRQCNPMLYFDILFVRACYKNLSIALSFSYYIKNFSNYFIYEVVIFETSTHKVILITWKKATRKYHLNFLYFEKLWYAELSPIIVIEWKKGIWRRNDFTKLIYFALIA